MPQENILPRYQLIPDGYFNLLEYIELKEARESSKKALWWAIAAMILSAVLAITSIIVSMIQLNSPVRIDDSQLKIICNNK